MTTYKLTSKLSAILVSSYPNVIAANNNTTTLGGILLNFLCLIVTK